MADLEGPPAEDVPRQDSDAVTTADGAVREMEKADVARRAGAGVRPGDPDSGGHGEVVPLGKARGQMAEDAVANPGEATGEV